MLFFVMMTFMYLDPTFRPPGVLIAATMFLDVVVVLAVMTSQVLR